MYGAFAATGPTDDELTVARKQMANTLEEQMREPSFWSRAMDKMSFRGTNLDDVVADPAAFQSLTADQIKQTFAKYAAPANRITVVVKPAADAAGDAHDSGN
jgi:predicted Zn-dependent peptidase